MDKWNANDDEMVEEIIDDVITVECEWSCDLTEHKEWLENLKKRFSNETK